MRSSYHTPYLPTQRLIWVWHKSTYSSTTRGARILTLRSTAWTGRRSTTALGTGGGFVGERDVVSNNTFCEYALERGWGVTVISSNAASCSCQSEDGPESTHTELRTHQKRGLEKSGTRCYLPRTHTKAELRRNCLLLQPRPGVLACPKRNGGFFLLDCRLGASSRDVYGRSAAERLCIGMKMNNRHYYPRSLSFDLSSCGQRI